MMLAAVDVSAGYRTAEVLREVSLSVEAGEIVAVVGRNGAGKTTLVKTLMGVIGLRGGRVLLDGEDVSRRPPSYRVRRGMRATYQERGLFSEISVADNLRLNGLRPDSHAEVLSMFGGALAGRHDQLAGSLSGGEQKMLAAAIALRTGASVLIMDEPSEGLQPSNVDLLGVYLSSARSEGCAILLIEQHLALAARVADGFIVLEKGEIADSGDADDSGITHRVEQHLVI